MKYMKTYEFFSSGYGNTSIRFSSLGSFITWTSKRYKEEEYDDEEFEEIISILENECKKFLDEVKESKVGPIFRGAKNVDDTLTNLGQSALNSFNQNYPSNILLTKANLRD